MYTRVPIVEFCTDETGAVTVDWMVLTAAVMGLGLAAWANIATEVEDLAGETSSSLTEADIVFQSRYMGRSIEDMALDMPVGNRGDAWKTRRVNSIQGLTDTQLTNQTQTWSNRTAETSNFSQERIDFEHDVRALEMQRRGI
ncbi:hypothetical protein E2K80_08935 [Rhodophyticola sp. CCM32]|uniref:hypothetical protein n=1 Tax=Rhodophyticola sp. CCM32 TaxID=2916397 RepID=UPI00107F91A3|nr:hypothetical protein [Rhodophyticola sp. CCM32]QBY00834.1 hypothetical protein E2K80_08935 [Rhodophyticola sp. CCM32]